MSEDSSFEARIRAILNRHGVDATTREELRSARRAALEPAPAPKPRGWIPAAAAAGIFLALGALFVYRSIDPPAVPGDAIEDLVVIGGEAELELLEDLEFYLWLEQEEKV